MRSPIQGIPFAVKDLLSYAGQPTTWGARPYAGQVFDHTATAVTKLDKAGAVLIGKLAMVELAGGPSYRYASASLTGPGLNPWDRTRWSGGSSSGSGIAVAAGLVPFAIGSETSGSILTPSAFCGITGLRPTYGLVSRYGAMALSWTLDKLGPMCRTAVDCALVLQAIAGGDNNDPGSAGKSFYYLPQFAKPLKELRAGYAPVDFHEWADPAARAAFQQALAVLREIGVQLMETKLPDLPYGPVLSTILASEAAEIFEPLISSGKVNELADQKQIAGLKAGLEIPAKDYLKAMRIRRLMKQEIAKMFTDLDLLVAPSRLGPATKVADPLDRRHDADACAGFAGHDVVDPGRQPGGTAGDRAAVRVRGQVAGSDSDCGSAVFGERAGGGGEGISGAHGLASAASARWDDDHLKERCPRSQNTCSRRKSTWKSSARLSSRANITRARCSRCPGRVGAQLDCGRRVHLLNMQLRSRNCVRIPQRHACPGQPNGSVHLSRCDRSFAVSGNSWIIGATRC